MKYVKSAFERIVLKLTHRIWNKRISAILCRAYMNNDISSETMHILAAKFDPTQKHEVY